MMAPFNPYAPYPMQNGMPTTMPTQPVMPTQPGPYPAFQQPMQPAPAVPEFDWIRVNTLDDVKNITVQPGKKAWIMLQNDPIFVVKAANDMGLATTQAFKFEPYNPQQGVQQTAEYAPMSLIEQMQRRIDDLSDELNALKGGAARGKSVKQPAATAD